MKKLPFCLIYLVSLCAVVACSKKSSVVTPVPVTPPVTKDNVTLSIDSVAGITVSDAVIYCKVIGKASSANADRGVCWSLTDSPQITDSTAKESSAQGDGTFVVNLGRLAHNTTYHVRGYVSGTGTVLYSKEITFKTAAEPAPVVTTDANFLAGATIAFVKGMVTSPHIIKESGVFISEKETPSASDLKVLDDKDERALFVRINNLKPNTDYYFRAFATTDMGITGYGAVVKMTTVQKGNLTYTFPQDQFASDDTKAAYKRITASLTQAVYLYNNLTPIVKNVNVVYNPGVPTAEANFDGYLAVGSSADYQRTGTILHELAHTLGVGTYWYWARVLINNGVYQGKSAPAVLQFLTRDPNAVMYGDHQHFWPFGINGAWEDTGDEMLYITNIMMVSAMRQDGLPSN